MSGSQPLTIARRHWPQTWQRAIADPLDHAQRARLKRVVAGKIHEGLFPLHDTSSKTCGAVANHTPAGRREATSVSRGSANQWRATLKNPVAGHLRQRRFHAIPPRSPRSCGAGAAWETGM